MCECVCVCGGGEDDSWLVQMKNNNNNKWKDVGGTYSVDYNQSKHSVFSFLFINDTVLQKNSRLYVPVKLLKQVQKTTVHNS